MVRRERSSTIFSHGYSGYTNYGCRCDECRTAATDYMRARRQRRAVARRAAEATSESRFVVAGVKHGANAYSNHSCRCSVCVTAWNGYYASRRAVS